MLLNLEAVWTCGRFSTALGFLLVILGDNAKTRHEVRLALMASGRDVGERVSRLR